MAQNYTRQSSFIDGDTVTAALFNNEYNQLVNAFAYSSSDASNTGHRHDGTAGQGGNVPQIGDLNFLNKVVVDSTNNRVGFFVEVSSSAVEQIRIQDGAIVPVTDNDIDLGTSSLQFKDAFINGTLEADAITIAGVTLAETISDTVGAMVGSNTETGITVTYNDSDNTLDFVIGSGVIVSSMLDTNIDISGVATASTFEPDGDTAAGDNAAIGYTAAEGLILTGQGSTNDVTIKNDADADVLEIPTGTVNVTVAGDLTAAGTLKATGDTAAGDGAALGFTAAEGLILTGQGSTNDVTVKNDADTAVIQIPTGTTNVSIAGNLAVTGDLTVSGDDITMGTNTAGHLLIADGTNFNAVAVGSLSEISTVADNDVFLAVDTSGGGLKKITRSTAVAGLGGISNVVEDTTPQLGGDLDVNGNDIISVSNGNINLLPNGSGKVIMDGNGSAGGVSITDGNIDIRTGTGAVSKIKFYCESSNAHAQTLQAQAHSASSSAVLTLPVATGTLIASGDSGTIATGMIADDAVTAAKLASSAVVTASIVDDNVTQAKIADDAVGADQLAASAVVTASIVDDAVTAAKLASSAVVTASIVDDNVTQAKIADDAVGADQLAASAVVTASIVDDAVTAAKLASNAVVTASIVDDNVTQAKIADDAVGADQLAASAVVTASIVDANVTTAKIADANVTTAKIADDAVTSAKVSSDIKVAGLETIYIPAAAMYPQTTNGCSDLTQVEVSAGKPELKCLDFAADADDHAQFTIAFPKSWNEGTVTFQAFFTVSGTNTGTVAWGLRGNSASDTHRIVNGFDSDHGVVATAKAHEGTANFMNLTAVSSAMTINGAGVNAMAFFQVFRDVSADTQTGAARLLGIKLFFTTDAANDA